MCMYTAPTCVSAHLPSPPKRTFWFFQHGPPWARIKLPVCPHFFVSLDKAGIHPLPTSSSWMSATPPHLGGPSSSDQVEELLMLPSLWLSLLPLSPSTGSSVVMLGPPRDLRSFPMSRQAAQQPMLSASSVSLCQAARCIHRPQG